MSNRARVNVATFARSANGGLVVTPSAAVSVHRALIIALAARQRLPAVYAFRSDISDGGLISFGPDLVDQFRRGAGYVDRILKGEKSITAGAPTIPTAVVDTRTN